MIYVRVELWPKGHRKSAKLLTEAYIANVGGTTEIGDYVVELMKDEKFPPPGVWREGRVKGFPRLKMGVWDLIYRALRATVGSRNK